MLEVLESILLDCFEKFLLLLNGAPYSADKISKQLVVVVVVVT
jgi:hypothetical protein